jgi:paraquat-inducible protein B
MADQDKTENIERTFARVERSRWPGWIWAVPITALTITAWLVFREISERGIPITIQFDRAFSMQAGSTSVRYLGINVGQVNSISLSPDGHHVIVNAEMDPDVKKYLRAKTRFWLEGAHPSLANPSSLMALVAGPTVIMQPGGGKETRHFIGLEERPTLVARPGTLRSYVMSFEGAVGQLNVGAPVTLRGFTVGEVKQIGFRYDTATGMIETPVTIALDPSRFHIQNMQTNESGRPGLNTVLNHLIERGMRGLLVQNPPIIGSYGISLHFVPHASEASLDTSGPLPRIPTAPGGGINSIIQRASEVPINQIAQNILKTTRHAESLVSSPELRASLKHLNDTMAGLNVTVHRTGPQVTRLVVSLRRTADSLRRTANQINRTTVTANAVLGGTPTSQDRNVRAALYELTQAARSIRSLANYLDRHPEALIRGRN